MGVVNFLSEKEIGTLHRSSEKQFSTKEDHYEFLMMEIQKHLVEINDLKEDKDPHLVSEIADLSVLTRMLALNQDATKSIFSERFKKFKKKIASD